MLKMTGTTINITMNAHFKLNCLVFHTTCNENWRLDWPYLLAFVTLHWPANWLLMSFSSLTVGGRIHTLKRPPWGQVIALWCLLTRRLGRVRFCMCSHTTNLVEVWGKTSDFWMDTKKKSLECNLRVEYSSSYLQQYPASWVWTAVRETLSDTCVPAMPVIKHCEKHNISPCLSHPRAKHQQSALQLENALVTELKCLD